MIQSRLYLAANAAFAACILAGLALHGAVANPLYLLILFALCSSPLLNVKQVGDEYFLLMLFSVGYFFWFGFLDFSHLLTGSENMDLSGRAVNTTEALVIVGLILIQTSYRLVCRLARPADEHRAPDWSEQSLSILGLTLWAVSTWLVWQYSVNIIADASVESVRRGLASLSGMQGIMFMLAIYFQPFSLMVLAYALFKYKRPYLIPVVAATTLVEFVLGFVTDAKGQALSGVMIVLIAKFLVDKKIPRMWLAAALAFVLVAFPLLQANRAVRHQRESSHAEAAADLGAAFQQALAAKNEDSPAHQRSQTIFERVSLKDILEVMVTKTGHEVAYRHGDTLVSLLTTFIPRVLWPDKPGIQVGLLVAKEFFPQESDNVNLSPSHLGEWYWNFGWLGVFLGMPITGGVLGLVGSRCNLSRGVTLTRVLTLLVTIQVLIQGFEASVAIQYSVWLRMMLGIGILHWLFSRRVVQQGLSEPGSTPSAPVTVAASKALPGVQPAARSPLRAPLREPHFPNLMR